MRFDKTARAILSVTALAWSIPFAQAAEPMQPGVIAPQPANAAFMKLDANGDGYLSFDEIAHLREYHQPFAEADRNGDGRLDAEEAIMAQQLYERALAARYAQDAWITARVKAALLREQGAASMSVSVETFDSRVLLSGFVADEARKEEALLVASGIAGVREVNDGLAIRN